MNPNSQRLHRAPLGLALACALLAAPPVGSSAESVSRDPFEVSPGMASISRSARAAAEAHLATKFGANAAAELVPLRNGVLPDFPMGEGVFTFAAQVVGSRRPGAIATVTVVIAVRGSIGSWKVVKLQQGEASLLEQLRQKDDLRNRSRVAELEPDAPPARAQSPNRLDPRDLRRESTRGPAPVARSVPGLYHGPGLFGWPCTMELLPGGTFVQKDPGLPGGSGTYRGDWAVEGKTVVFYGGGQRLFHADIRDGSLVVGPRVWKRVR